MAPPPPGYPTNEIFGVVSTPPGTVYVRRGFYDGDADQGFGFDKVYHKHNITSMDAIRFVLNTPKYVAEGRQWKYTAYAYEWLCDSSGCELVQQIEVRGIWEPTSFDTYYGWPVGGQLGLMTMYCIGYIRCPNWVTGALSAQGLAAEASGPTEPAPVSTGPHKAWTASH